MLHHCNQKEWTKLVRLIQPSLYYPFNPVAIQMNTMKHLSKACYIIIVITFQQSQHRFHKTDWKNQQLVLHQTLYNLKQMKKGYLSTRSSIKGKFFVTSVTQNFNLQFCFCLEGIVQTSKPIQFLLEVFKRYTSDRTSRSTLESF